MNAVVGVGLGLIVAIGCAHEAAERRIVVDNCDVEGEPAIPCTPEATDVARSDGKIEIDRGSISAYVGAGGKAAPAKADTLYAKAQLQGSALHVMAHPSALQAGFVVLQFPKCIDASAWTGIRFEIRGSFRGCSMKFGSADIRYGATGAPWGADLRPPRPPPETKLALTSSTHKAQLVEVPFEDLEADLKSVHTTIAPPPFDPSRLTSMAWMLFDDMSGTCAADLYVDSLSFY
jgi:hypothetical protein